MRHKSGTRLATVRLQKAPGHRARTVRPLRINPAPAWTEVHTDGLLRMSAATAQRFVRDRIPGCPVAWMKSRRNLFDGKSAVEACGTIEGVRRALVVHALSLDVDSTPDDTSGLPACTSAPNSAMSGETKHDKTSDTLLFTATIVGESQGQHVQIFSARLIDSAQSFRYLLEVQFGSWLASEAIIQQGFDPSEPIANSLLSEATADYLTALKNRGFARQAAPFEFHVEQRFPA